MDKKTLDISWGTLWRVLFFVVLVSIMYSGRKILLGLFLAIVISSGLEFIVRFLEKKGVPRALGVILIFLAATLLVVVTVYTIIPLIVVDLNIAFSNLMQLARSSWWGPLVSSETTKSIEAVIGRISSQFLSGGASPFGAFSDVLGGVLLAISVLVSSFYLTLTHDGIVRFIRAVFPADYEETALRIYDRSRRKIGSWFRTQIILSIVMSGLVLVTLLLLGVKYAFLLAVFAGIFELVPFVGPILSGALAFVSALLTSPSTAFYTILAFFALHQIENHVLIPLFFGRTVGLHPVIVIIALLMGWEVGGFLGILISVPAAAVFQEVLEEWSSKKRSSQAALL